MRFLLSVTIERVLHETKLKIRVEQEKRKYISFNLTEAHAILRQLGKDFFYKQRRGFDLQHSFWDLIIWLCNNWDPNFNHNLMNQRLIKLTNNQLIV